MKSYREFINESTNYIESVCNEYNITNYTINSDGTIDVDRVDIEYKGLVKLPLKFGRVRGSFYCSGNFLSSLEGCPKEIGIHFDCSDNELTSLENCPNKVGNSFFCGNNKLTSLVGCPEKIVGDFYCDDNKIKDFKGISEFFEGDFYCTGNPIWEIWNLFNDVRCIRWINEFDVIVDGKKVILDRLEEVFHQLEIEIPKNIEFDNYEII
jgi:hypothetical protein